MPKYHLVASYYDMYERNPNLRYKDEVEISLPNIELSTIQEIDCFTASHTRLEIFNILANHGITGKNLLAIKFQKNQTTTPEHYRIIENNPAFIDCTKDNNKISYYAFGRNIRSLGVPQNNPLFLAEKNILLNLLDEGNHDELKKKFPFPKSMLYRLIDEYFNAPHDNDQDKELIKRVIEIEFSRYKTFRGWMIVKGNPAYYERRNNPPTNQVTPSIPKKTITPKTHEEYEEEYKQKFNKDNKDRKITYDSNQTYLYNTSRLEEDKEEFLEESDFSSIYQDNPPNYEPKEVKSSVRKRSKIKDKYR